MAKIATPDDLVRWAAPLSFRIADKFFKIVSWAILLTFLRYADRETGSTPLHVVSILATMILGSVVILQAMYISMRDPGTLGVSEDWHGVSRVVQILVGFAFASVLTAPQLYLDQIIAAIEQARPR